MSVSRIEHCRALHMSESFIVDPVFPAGALHLLGGPSGIGKTTWLLQQLRHWSQGEDVMGYKSHPCEWRYVSFDRSTMDTYRTMRRLGLGNWDAPVFSVEEICPRNSAGALSDPNIFQLVKAHPQVKLWVLEGLQGFLPDTPKGRSQNKAEMLWMVALRDMVLSKGITVIAVTHSPKMAEAYIHNRSNFLGTQSLIGGCSTLVSFDLPSDVQAAKGKLTGKAAGYTNDRLVTVMGRDFSDHYLNYTRSTDGGFLLSSMVKMSSIPDTKGPTLDITMGDDPDFSEIKLDTLLSLWPLADTLTVREFKQWQIQSGLSLRTMWRWVSDQIAAGRLRRVAYGRYERSKPS